MQNIKTKEKFIYKPAYKEVNAIPLWFCFPSTYSIGMSSLGYLSLFRLLDQNSGVFPERIFVDTEHTVHNPKNVELLGFSVSFELDFIGIFNILSKYNIPFKSSDRDINHPIVFGGGPVLSSNPEPYADFFDVILVGEGEEILLELVEKYNEIRNIKDRNEQLVALSQIDGLYVPSLYEVDYNPDNTIKSFAKKDDRAPEVINKRCLSSLDECIYSPIMTDKSMFGDMFLMEIARGCARKCRFCLASYMTLPARYPDYQTIIKAIDIGIENAPKIGLLGALIADHPDFEKICRYIQEKLGEKKFEVSVSSLRADGITELVASTLVKGGQHQATIAVESGSERLRKIINKHLSQDNIFKSVKAAREQGLTGLKIYGIIGLPTETQEEIDELINLMAGLKKENKGFKLTLSISSFVPKSHTPFQWELREDNKILQDKTEYLRKKLIDKKVLFKPTSIKWDYIQAILSRGDRRLSPLLEKVYKYSGSLGSWGRSYKEVIEEKQYNIPELDWYALRKRPYEEILPWDFMNLGIDKENLWKEKNL